MTELIIVMRGHQKWATEPQEVFSDEREQQRFDDRFFQAIRSDLEDYRRAHRESEAQARACLKRSSVRVILSQSLIISA